jgi:phosphate transport system substrate-binding protein
MLVKWIALSMVVASAATVTTDARAQVRAAGSTFAEDLYLAWADVAANKKAGSFQYEPSGSSGGIRSDSDNAVDFGASEVPLNREQLARARLHQVPTAAGGVVMIVNLGAASNKSITLNGAVISDIYRGSIKRWNASEIKALNPDVTLPDLAILPVVRAEGSGTSFVFASYLSKASPAWKTSVGATNAIKLPGTTAAPSNKAVAEMVKARAGAIGYVEYSFASELGLPTARMVNRWGERVKAEPEAIRQAVQAADWDLIRTDNEPTFELDVTDAGCPRCWPMAAVTYALIPRSGRNVDRALEFLRVGMTDGRESIEKIGYVALPSRADRIVRAVMSRWGRGRAETNAGRFTASVETAGASRLVALQTTGAALPVN